jgi:WD40 repeat protein
VGQRNVDHDGAIAAGHESAGREFRLANAVTVAISTNGQWLAASDEEGHVRVWETEPGRLLVELPRQPAPVESLALAADGRHCITLLTNEDCIVWELPVGRAVARFTNASHPNFDVAGRQIIFQQDREVILANTSDGAILRRWPETSIGDESPFSPDGQSLVLFVGVGTPQWSDCPTGRPLGEALHYELAVEFASFSPDGQTLAVGTASGDIALWRKPRARLPSAQLANSNLCYAVSARSAWLAAPTGASVRLLNSAGDLVRSLAGPGTVTAVDFDRSAATIAAGTDGGELRVWRIADGTEVLRTALATNPIAFARVSPDGQILAAVTLTGLLQQWNIRTGHALTPPFIPVHTAAPSPTNCL